MPGQSYKIERQQTIKMRLLLNEYRRLRNKLFQGLPFAEEQDTADWRRYNQLFAYFYPQFRTANFVEPEPLEEYQVN